MGDESLLIIQRLLASDAAIRVVYMLIKIDRPPHREAFWDHILGDGNRPARYGVVCSHNTSVRSGLDASWVSGSCLVTKSIFVRHKASP